MARKPWKNFELKIAKMMGTSRKLMKGTGEISDIGGDDPDFPLVLDCKLRKRESWHVIVWLMKVEEAARSNTGKLKWPVLCLREPGKIRSYAVVRREPFMKFIVDKVNISPDRYFVKDIPSSYTTPILRQWDTLIKESQEYKRKEELDHVITMMNIHNTHYDIEITVLKPEDLALIFREGGLLK